MNYDAQNRIFRNPSYKRHNSRRQEHLATLDLDVFARTVLELGAGVGDHTTFFLDRGCTVTSVEARADNCDMFAKIMTFVGENGYAAASRSRLIQADVTKLPPELGRYDIVYAYGILYHLSDPEKALQSFASHTEDLLLLETCVSVGDYESPNYVAEVQSHQSQSFQGIGCRPTRRWLFNKLKTLFPFVYVPTTQPVHEDFPVDWTVAPKTEFTRAVFIGSRKPIANSRLLDHLPEKQSYR
ncbi:class I SAM-dependent methyltransferase [Dongia rigui]|uniref:Class I SAM-dependent methyltransferase n=1 Tax=Dongia rigui TaxID=940149 RepID=A0ABU5DX53_9PROT|nr:class I SAM-dependent methyltransferase [Dongia rigui]MDY0871872.1 class I SAM-dependent methyltransferase [Dongia rigui]